MEEKFIEVIKEYIDLIDNCEDRKVPEFFFQCSILLPQILYLGQLLPFPDWWDDEDDEDYEDEGKEVGDTSRKQKMKKWNELEIKLEKFLGDKYQYRFILEPFNKDDDISTFRIPYDLAEIYLDVNEPLEHYSDDRNKSLFEWKLGVHAHTGWHINGVLAPIYWYLMENDEEIGW